MKKSVRLSLLLILALVLAFSAFAQDNSKKTEEFQKIAKLAQTKKTEDQDKAFKLAKDFLAQYGKTEDDQVKKIRDFHDKYRLQTFNKRLDELKIAEAYSLGKEMLAVEPENTYVVINMAYGGYDLYQKKQDSSFGADSVAYAQQALSLLEAGKIPSNFEPFKSQAEATAIMHYIVGNFTFDKDPQEAAKSFYKALQYESQIKNTSYPYYAIAFGYEKAYEKLAKAYQAKVTGNAPEKEILADQDKLKMIVDRMLDAYARAIKLAEIDNKTNKDIWLKRFTEIYKHKNQSETGLNEYLNAASAKPLPDPSQI